MPTAIGLPFGDDHHDNGSLCNSLPLFFTGSGAEKVISGELCEKANEKLAHPWFAAEIIAVNPLTKPKNCQTLLAAFTKGRQAKTCGLLILGKGELRAEQESLVEPQPKIKAHDFENYTCTAGVSQYMKTLVENA